ncbi:uncharacterized protein YukE [Nocardia sp. GAS34]|uniref:WXG100 family type VII secretion target n=1 Tax=unclassified Nocardia TaxID=2637762 RepID=UPI003D19D6D8
MKFDFTAVDEHTATLRQLVTSMETNLANMQSLKNELLSEFQGAGAHGYETTFHAFQQKLDSYNTAIHQLEVAVGDVAGSQGQMSATDRSNANRFLAIKV